MSESDICEGWQTASSVALVVVVVGAQFGVVVVVVVVALAVAVVVVVVVGVGQRLVGVGTVLLSFDGPLLHALDFALDLLASLFLPP